MSLSVQTNVAAMDAHRNLVNTANLLSASMPRRTLDPDTSSTVTVIWSPMQMRSPDLRVMTSTG